MTDRNYRIPRTRFNNVEYVEQRTMLVPPDAQGSVRTALSYLYLSSGAGEFASRTP